MFDIRRFYDMIKAEGAKRRVQRRRREESAMDFEAIKRAAKGYEADMSRFLRDLIAIPSESCEEEAHGTDGGGVSGL